MDSSHTNAIAGPSNLRTNSSRPSSPSRPLSTSPHSNAEPLQLFLPPPGPPQSPAYIKSTQDLLAQFHLRDAYDKYVRPFIASSEDADDGIAATSPVNTGQNGMLGASDKGKGKEKEPVPQTPTAAADGQDGDDDDAPGGKGEKKKKNSYKHLIKGVPGKHSLKKDDYLTTMMQAPPKSRVRISEFDSRTQRDAFTVSLEGLKGWNPSALVLESAQAREDRKKRKELKRLAKAQMQAQSQVPTQQSSPAASTPIQAPIPTSAISASFPASAPTSSSSVRPPNTSATPRPGPASSATPRPHPVPTSVNRPGSAKPGLPPVQIPAPGVRVGTPLRTATPTAPHPLSAPPLSASAIAPPGGGFAAPPPPSAAAGAGGLPRGKKRERDDTLPLGNGNTALPNQVHTNGFTAPPNNGGVANAASPPKAIVGARAGNNNVRPRPLKKQRMDSQGVARDTAPVQQHTPV